MIEGANHWPDYIRFRDRFAEAMDSRFYTIEWLDRKIWTGEFRLWANDDAAIVAKIKEYPTGALAVHGMIAAGDLNAITGLVPLAEQWGKARGCIVAEIASREGWGRVLPEYAVHQIEIVKEL